MDMNFCILLFYIILRNLMEFNKEFAILYGFFKLRISKKYALLGKSVNWDRKSFLLIFYLVLYQNSSNFV